MTLTKRTLRNFIGVLIASALIPSAIVLADDYQDARAELVAAYQAEDFSGMQLAAQKAVIARPEYPGALFNLALAYTLNDRHRDSLRILRRLTEKGVDFGVADIEEFRALRDLDTWDSYLVGVQALSEPVGFAEVISTYPDSNFIPEGIAIDDDGHLILGSIRRGQILKLAPDPEIMLDREQHWSVFGMRFHSDGSLWFASAAVPQLADVGDDEGKTGLYRFDISAGEITQAAILPQYEPDQVLGDLVIADDNTIYATDSLTGAIYRYYIDSNEFEFLVERGKLGSPQGLVLDEAGGYLYVADYIGGLYRVSTQDGSLVRLSVAASITDYGIDGLYRYGDELIVIQNGVSPHRVVALQLAENGLAIASSRLLASNLKEFDEPTLGVVQGDEFFFVANSHWNRFDRENQLPGGLSGPIVLKLSLD
jgi:sugar lactone lactonase YvrE